MSQQLLDRIVARAQNSAMGLCDPEEGKTYSLAAYEDKGFESIALVLVGAHYSKYDLVSLFCAAMEEVKDCQQADKQV